jgi:preprotein translocase subunit SecD
MIMSDMSLRVKFGLILLLALVTTLIALPREDEVFKFFGIKNVKMQVKQGLDLQGGAQLVFQADLSKVSASKRETSMQQLVTVMQKRANPGGTSEVVVQRQGGDRIIISLPGEKDVAAAIARIGKTGNLVFIQVDTTTGGQKATGITGNDVDSATADYDPTTSQPIVRLKLKGGDATKRFGVVTTEINQNGTRLVTLLDQDVVFGPATVSSPILDGTAQLQGNFTIKTAKDTADLINAGALPVSVTLVEQRTVGPTLGRESVSKSFVAGAIGLIIVALFMILYYRLAGVLAVGALFIYTTTTITIYKLSVYLPGYTIVLTLAGIAGFILSIGMAVDANILIFERMKEELRAGKSFIAATEAAFDRAWTSIRDSNVSTLITCVILYLSSGSTPIIRGFAVTLGLGVLVSLFTAVVVTRTFLRLTVRQSWGRNPKWYGMNPEEIE